MGSFLNFSSGTGTEGLHRVQTQKVKHHEGYHEVWKIDKKFIKRNKRETIE
ncbi:hypothetical protein DPMN_113576 [Dreissena polymorpha]|uniref:Uncharacterized protein n=1 Tax=Dreissena polymorpha TaxID=45954 RepID=A0A9D4KIX0_DREPO|nr:hypothetical protein DPMN_113576 [Dreissena polymorpha]